MSSPRASDSHHNSSLPSGMAIFPVGIMPVGICPERDGDGDGEQSSGMGQGRR
ncbi:hypothetical protein TIFTF001_012885 [Ficus carica]|uniref:Uncharacterized protein n=1 Tax=Ficus carica TaxID=3494 RepID=A0AA88D5I3_FICCA|nr:hypothetical protein TIFTF001_012885 [Ficus carica]